MSDELNTLAETPAPLPEEVEQMITELVKLASNYAPDIYWECIHGHGNDIRAHIAAQAENLAELEADNKRLRDALSQCKSELMSIHMQHGDEAHAAEMSAGIRMAQAATAHTEDGKAAHHD